MLDADLRTVVHATRVFLPHIQAAGRGHLVFVSSMAGRIAFPTQTTYSAAKFGVCGFASSLRMELAGEGIGVSTILPGTVATGFPSGGLVQRSAFYLLRGTVPMTRMIAEAPSHLERFGMRVFAPHLVKTFPYSSNFFFDAAAKLLDAVDIPVALLGGVDSAESVEQAMTRGFPFVVMGRALLSDPDFVRRMEAGERVVSRCTHATNAWR